MILQVFIALPKVFSMIASLVKAVKEAELKMKESALASAALKAQAAQTKQEAEIVNKEITSNIP
jgi:hypothetical protein